MRKWILNPAIVGLLALCVLPWIVGTVEAQTREEKVRNDRSKFESLGLWHYNNLEAGFQQAKSSGQPIMIVLRCIPCEECVKLDDDLIEADPKLQQLLKSFVRVRVIATNGLDLSLFEYDTDQSFAVFFFNADKTLYARYGTRSDRTEWKDDVSVEGLGKAMTRVLDLHSKFPSNRDQLSGKQATQPLFPSPEKFPSLATNYTSQLDYQGNVVKSCVHCHQIGDAIKSHYRKEQGTIPDKWLYPYPHPKNLGLIFDPKESSTLLAVTPGSVAATAGFQAGDQIELLGGQPIVSIADAQWVLHSFPSDGGELTAEVTRDSKKQSLKMVVAKDWRTHEDIAWRASSWHLRQSGLGGMIVKPISTERMNQLGIPAGQMALEVGHVGAYPPHDRAKNAGVVKGDILIEYDGRRDFLRETDLLAYAINKVEIGRVVPMRFRRGDKEIDVKIATAK